MTQDDLFTQNATMRKLAHLCAITANSPEGQEVRELIQALSEQGGGYMNPYMIASFAYALGEVRGKQMERARRKQAG